MNKRTYRKEYYNKKRNKGKSDGKSIFSWIWEFSKKLVLILSVMYVIETFYIMAVMVAFNSFDYLGTFMEQTSDVLKVCVFGYFIKAGLENVPKIIVAHFDKKKVSEVTNETEDNDEFI